MIWILFYYNSLPQFPENCSFISNEIVHRDYFMCNPTNTGHYQYPLFEKLAYDTGCHTKEVANFLKKEDPDKYVIFYTRMTDSNGKSKNRVVGYLKVGKLYDDATGFYASESVLLSREDCIDIDFNGRSVPVSWGNSKVKVEVESILKYLKSKSTSDISSKYKTETTEVMSRISNSNLRKDMLSLCNNCESSKNCFWGKSSNNKKNLFLEKYYAQKSKTC